MNNYAPVVCCKFTNNNRETSEQYTWFFFDRTYFGHSFVEILGITTVTLFRPVAKANLNTVSTNIFSLLREAQNQAINTDTSGDPQSNDYGVHFETDSYTLFKGSTYISSDSSNFVVATKNNISISPSLPCPSPPEDCNNVVFEKISGEVLGFDPTKNTVCVTETGTNKQILINVNFVGGISVQDEC